MQISSWKLLIIMCLARSLVLQSGVDFIELPATPHSSTVRLLSKLSVSVSAFSSRNASILK